MDRYKKRGGGSRVWWVESRGMYWFSWRFCIAGRVGSVVGDGVMNVSLRDFLGGDCEGFSGQKDCMRLSWTSDIVCLNILGFGGFFYSVVSARDFT